MQFLITFEWNFAVQSEFGDIYLAHLIPLLWMLGKLVVIHDASLVLRGPVAHPHPSELLRALLGESGAWWGHACLL